MKTATGTVTAPSHVYQTHRAYVLDHINEYDEEFLAIFFGHTTAYEIAELDRLESTLFHGLPGAVMQCDHGAGRVCGDCLLMEVKQKTINDHEFVDVMMFVLGWVVTCLMLIFLVKSYRGS